MKATRSKISWAQLFVLAITSAMGVLGSNHVLYAEGTETEGKTLYRISGQGKGDAVCETYKKVLNTYGAEGHPATCTLKLSPRFPQISKVNFDELDIWKYAQLVWKMDIAIYRHAESDRKRRDLTFEQWRDLLRGEIAKGESTPILQRARLQYPGGSMTVLGYDRGERIPDCAKGAPTKEAEIITNAIGLHLFIFNERSGEFLDEKVNPIFRGKYEVVRFKDSYYAISSEYSPAGLGQDLITLFDLKLVPGPESWGAMTIASPIYNRRCQYTAELKKIN